MSRQSYIHTCTYIFLKFKYDVGRLHAMKDQKGYLTQPWRSEHLGQFRSQFPKCNRLRLHGFHL